MVSVIVVDDDHDVAEALSDCLMIKGIKVLAEGKNGLEAIELYKKFGPDFVLLDISMPNYDGYYGIKKILEYDNNAKVIIVSASCTQEDLENLFVLGALDVVAKPYEIDSLINIMMKTNKEKNSNLEESSISI